MAIAAKDPVSITLLAEEWNTVLDVLSDGKYRAVGPLIQKIVEQAQKTPETVEPQRLKAGELTNVLESAYAR